MTSPCVLTLPGWNGSGPGHWQSRWESLYGDQRVEQTDWVWPRRGDWMARLDEVLLAQPKPVLLAAHSLGCHLVAAWAAHSRHTGRVTGALLVAIPDVERAEAPPQLHNWRPVVRQRLPFPAIAAQSRDDPFADFPVAAALAVDWGARLVATDGQGHLNADSGLGEWPAGRAWLDTLAEAAAAAPRR
jgi:predicted alpha/beta hydrolase family esterase